MKRQTLKYEDALIALQLLLVHLQACHGHLQSILDDIPGNNRPNPNSSRQQFWKQHTSLGRHL
jgi:hypothetical protein